MGVAEAARRFGFKSRSSYYLFAALIREQGFAGVLDLRPSNAGVRRTQTPTPRKAGQIPTYPDRLRPEESLWACPADPWRNAFYGLQKAHHGLFVQIVRAVVEGNGVRGISRIFDVDANTVLHYLQRAARQCRRVTDRFLQGLHVDELQLDEMWSFVCKKQKRLTPQEEAHALKGDQWCWLAFDARSRVIVQYEIGKRTYRLARDLLRHFRERTDGTAPRLVTSDEYAGYEEALLAVYGSPGGAGASALAAQMDYAVVSKTREKGRVVAIEVKVIFGLEERVRQTLEESPVSKHVNTAFVERSHLSRRQFNRRLARKTLGFSKKLENHLWQYELETTMHNFVRPHRGLKNRTPMMAAGKTDHPWSVEELMAFCVP